MQQQQQGSLHCITKAVQKQKSQEKIRSIVSFLHRRLVQLRTIGPASSQTFLENIHPRFVVAKVLLLLLLLQYTNSPTPPAPVSPQKISLK